MIGFQRRFDPTFNEAKARLSRGEIGTPEMLVITSRDPGAPPVDYLKQSGGIFRDMLIHDFDVFRWLLCDDGQDEAVWLSATGACLTDPAIAEAGDIDSTAVTLRTRSGRLCQINTSRRPPMAMISVSKSWARRACLAAATTARLKSPEWGCTAFRPTTPRISSCNATATRIG